MTLVPAMFCQSYKYIRVKNPNDVNTHPRFGIAMMGGDSDPDEAFRWLCMKGDGGDFLIMRSAGDDEYNSYVADLCKANSVATLIIPDRVSTLERPVSEVIRDAEVIFIAGGDQARYINYWKGTPVQNALNANLAEGKPIGGTSAGLAVLGEFVYGALQDKDDDKDLSSPEVLRDPYFHRGTLVRDFLNIPLLKNTLTDSHFAKRDRMGRSLGFLSRIVQDGWSPHPHEIAIDEKSAVLVEPDDSAKVVGNGKGAYFLTVTTTPVISSPGKPLTIRDIGVQHIRAGASFNLNSWGGDARESYTISVIKGEMRSTNGSIY
jgi:cyanophycinase